ncbi:sulfotransferase 2A1-like [Amphiura filiformis]|uniref:sulfotransferase 2A1-like n=1 Tax=Amphiura filiformis TaxID=82378 RepID=UPI003B212D0F
MDQIKTAKEYNIMMGAYEHEGIKFVPYLTPPETWTELQEFEVRDDDVFIISVPKSGSHWMIEIVQLLHNDAQADKVDRSNLDTALETRLGEGTLPGYKKAVSWNSPRVILSHCHAHLLPRQVWQKKPKVIYMVRNPKDVAVSGFNFLKQVLPPFIRDVNAYTENVISDDNIGCDWFKHVLGYLPHENDDNFLLVKYEDLQKDLKGQLVRINDHLGRPLPQDKLDQVAQLSTFSGMQKSYAEADRKAAEKGQDYTPSKVAGTTSYLNKGKVGQWKELFSVEVNAKFDKIYQEKMQGSGLTVDFE